MSELTCPHCQATLDVDAELHSLPDSCPFCDGDLTGIERQIAVTESPPAVCSKKSNHRAANLKLPSDSRITILTPEPGQMVLQIPPGKSGTAWSLLIFAFIWNAIVLAVGSVFLFVPQQNQPPAPWFLIPFFGIFLLVGLIVLYAGIAMKFTRTMLLLEPDRAVMQKIIFNRKSIREITLSDDAQASLVESYRENDRPIYAVSVVSGDDSLKFGTSLTTAEKDRLVAIINSHLGHDERDEAVGPPGWQQELIVPCEISPDDLSQGTQIQVLEHRPDELVFSFPLIPSSGFKWFLRSVMIVMGLGGTMMLAFAVFAIQRQVAVQINSIWLILPAVLMLIIPCGIVLLIHRLCVTIGINGEQIVHLISSGPFRWKRVWETATVTGVTIRSNVVNPARDQHQRPPTGQPVKIWSLCTLDFPEQYHWLSIGPQKPFCREVAGLVRYQLHRLGNQLLDDSAAE